MRSGPRLGGLGLALLAARQLVRQCGRLWHSRLGAPALPRCTAPRGFRFPLALAVAEAATAAAAAILSAAAAWRFACGARAGMLEEEVAFEAAAFIGTSYSSMTGIILQVRPGQARAARCARACMQQGAARIYII